MKKPAACRLFHADLQKTGLSGDTASLRPSPQKFSAVVRAAGPACGVQCRSCRARPPGEHADPRASPCPCIAQTGSLPPAAGLASLRQKAPRQEAFIGAAVVRIRINVAHEVEALRTVAVLDGEADAVEREADATPGTIERLVHHQHHLSASAERRYAPAPPRCGVAIATSARALGTEADHQATQHLGLELGSAGRGCQIVESLARWDRFPSCRGGDVGNSTVPALLPCSRRVRNLSRSGVENRPSSTLPMLERRKSRDLGAISAQPVP